MLRTVLLIVMGLLVAACDRANQNPAEENDSAEAASPKPVAYYEYLWCKEGENNNDETVAAFVADWNKALDGMEQTLSGAFAYIPRGWKSEDFDGLWVLRWPDKDTMQRGWANYAESGTDESLAEAHPGVLACGNEAGVNRFGFDLYAPIEVPDGFANESPYFLQNQFCTFNEGKVPEDLTEVIREDFLPVIRAGKEQGIYSSYWFMVGVPDGFEPAQPMDFNWIDFWNTADEGPTETAFFEGTKDGQAVMERFNEVMTCSESQPWDGYVLRNAEAT